MNIAIVLIAGNSTRINSITVPKQFYLVNNKPLFIYTLETFNNSQNIDEIILVTKKECISEVTNLCHQFNINKVNFVVPGGLTRQESVYNGLNAKKYNDDDIVLIHDGARPLVSEDIIKRNIESCLKDKACVTAIKATDTLLQENDSYICKYIDREKVYQLQTPQTFIYSLIKKAHEEHKDEVYTDDSSLVSKYQNVSIVEGSKLNFKVTTNDDLIIFESIVRGK